jgi:N-acetylglucosaminyldiphosphoundecaprenol N-acetyl-beta-D-mannosaminyltransferase
MTQVLHTRIDTVDYSEAVQEILRWSGVQASRYVCVANVHVLMEAHDSVDFSDLVNEADLIVPDGMPLVWMRVYGPTLMLRVLEQAARQKMPVGFFGGTPDVLKALVEKMGAQHEGLDVAISLSPPFRELSPVEDGEIVRQINGSGARILFVGLGCPKQEMWMAAHRGRVQAVMIGVGAAFDFHAGVKPQAPAWIQRLGLEWAFRFAMEPRRLWRRYLYHNPRFLFLALADLLGVLKV